MPALTNELGETTAFGYDGNRNRTLVRDPELNATTTIFDERDLPYQTTDAESRVTRLGYQPNGTLAQVTDGNGPAQDERRNTLVLPDCKTGGQCTK